MDSNLLKIINFFKKIFGEDFKLNGFSNKKNVIIHIDENTRFTDVTIERLNIISTSLFIDIHTKTLWYDPSEGILYTYPPQTDAFFKKVITNAWSFRYMFNPLFIKGWGDWSRVYSFQVLEKGKIGNYHTIDYKLISGILNDKFDNFKF